MEKQHRPIGKLELMASKATVVLGSLMIAGGGIKAGQEVLSDNSDYKSALSMAGIGALSAIFAGNVVLEDKANKKRQQSKN